MVDEVTHPKVYDGFLKTCVVWNYHDEIRHLLRYTSFKHEIELFRQLIPEKYFFKLPQTITHFMKFASGRARMLFGTVIIYAVRKNNMMHERFHL